MIRDNEKDIIKKDSSTSQFEVICLHVSTMASSNVSLASIDIKATYLQSGPVKRHIYLRHPIECNGPREVV